MKNLCLYVHYIGSKLVIQVGPVRGGVSSTCLPGVLSPQQLRYKLSSPSSRSSTCLLFLEIFFCVVYILCQLFQCHSVGDHHFVPTEIFLWWWLSSQQAGNGNPLYGQVNSSSLLFEMQIAYDIHIFCFCFVKFISIWDHTSVHCTVAISSYHNFVGLLLCLIVPITASSIWAPVIRALWLHL